jgi:hypothetical protein
MNAGTGFFAGAMLLTALVLGGCGEGGLGGSLRGAGLAGTPDEFMVLPTKPLEIPENLAAKPLLPPTTGSSNLVDYNPRVEAVAALTGRPGLPATASGAGLVAQVGAGSPNIRPTLAAEDVTYSQQNKGLFFERIFSRDDRALNYRGMMLQPGFETERLRAQGQRVPPAPPDDQMSQ